MAHGWTPERRARQAELIRNWRPWEQTTGPKTAEGKARVARNGYKGGIWKIEREMKKQVNQMLREQRALVEGLTSAALVD
ncbi:MAG: hypothetical protein EOO27_00960 [Comamonadaceae bacterium]|nr:MAG: hypothetical protein EOO27_00960 [Comamonadaceae bacterium]